MSRALGGWPTNPSEATATNTVGETSPPRAPLLARLRAWLRTWPFDDTDLRAH